MGVINPRYRVVTFRLSLSEYESVHAAAEYEGARSLSAFARAAVLERAMLARTHTPEQEQLSQLNQRSEEMLEMLRTLDHHLRDALEHGATQTLQLVSKPLVLGLNNNVPMGHIACIPKQAGWCCACRARQERRGCKIQNHDWARRPNAAPDLRKPASSNRMDAGLRAA
jgi:hypothetical protein